MRQSIRIWVLYWTELTWYSIRESENLTQNKSDLIMGVVLIYECHAYHFLFQDGYALYLHYNFF